MPQGPLNSLVAQNAARAYVPLQVDANGNLKVTTADIPAAPGVRYDITAATIVKAAPGVIVALTVQVAGSATGTVNDCLTTGAAAIANQVAVIPETVGPLALNWPCLTGIVVVPGTGQTISVTFL